ncbi:sugar-binding transcriptional regulator [Paenibacillus sp. FSL R7-0331]|uniref:sugar-binding transcriptional regulator n=1 Tax=Paenibacillus sp. FSL R7-0331 TaxID=1536773 RepID=UPI0004F67013|nr:sugar-binding transcriptional regulator [Paenibacillus sp. FSL R7-0331]AIQ52942.1 Cro/Cl family transcriptional regulator [Paenibacillus sp. FSL R7-0331]
MNLKDERKLLIRIARMYYEQDMTQSEISKVLGIYRTTISRLLKRVREEGIVTITIHDEAEDQFSLEQELCRRFGLQEAIVVTVDPGQSGELKRQAMGQACARWLQQRVKSKDVIGFSWGSSLAAVVEAMQADHMPFITFLPMVGGPSGRLESRFHVNTLCYQAASRWRARSLMIDAPAVTEHREIKDLLMQAPYFQQITGYWDTIDIALFGIGSAEIQGSEAWRGFYGEAVISELESGLAAGDICSRFYNSEGVPVNTSLDGRTLTITLEQIAKARLSVGIAESKEKVPGILGALRGGYMNVLVTTEETALELLGRGGDVLSI